MHGFASSLCLFALTAPGFDQEPQPTRQPPPPAATPPAQAPREQPPSPFATDAELRAVLGDKPAGTDGFLPLDERPALPEMHLRGIVRFANKEKSAALIEVQGFGSYTARQGDSIAFTLSANRLTAPSARNAIAAATAAPAVDGGARVVDELRKTSDQRAAATPPAPAAGGGAAPRSPAGVGVLVSTQIPIVLRVVRVDRDGVVVEIGTLGQLMVIR